MSGVCTIGVDSSIKIETNVSTKKKEKFKKVTFSRELPTVISYDREEDEEGSNHEIKKTDTVPDATSTVSCKKCKEKKRINIRMSFTLGTGGKEKVKKSVFDVVFKWFSKFLWSYLSIQWQRLEENQT